MTDEIWDVVDRRNGQPQMPDLFESAADAEAAIEREQAMVHSLPEADMVWAMSLETRLQGHQCDRSLESRLSPVPHDYKVVGTEYGSLAEGGSYTELRCRACGRVAYSPLPD